MKATKYTEDLRKMSAEELNAKLKELKEIKHLEIDIVM